MPSRAGLRVAVRGTLALGLLGTVLTAAVFACSGGGDDGGLPDTSSEAGLSDQTGGSTGDGAGGGGDAMTDGGPPTEKQACEAYVQAICDRALECGVKMDCERQLALCPDYLFAAGSTTSVADVLACAAVHRAQRCEEFMVGIVPSCDTAGTRQQGEPCVFDTQCASLACTGSNVACGACLGIAPPGVKCKQSTLTCGPNKYCANDAGCVSTTVDPRLPPGSKCPTHDGGLCPADAPCTATTPNADAGTCTVGPTSGACLYSVPSAFEDTCGAGAQCSFIDAASPSGTCFTGGVAPGYACGSAYAPLGDPNGGLTCAVGSTCSNPFQGTCVPDAKLGETCSATLPCTPGTYCHLTSATKGLCTAGVAIGETCGALPDGGGFVACAKGDCADVPTEAGTKTLCINKPARDQEPCSFPLSPCSFGLVCEGQGVCHVPACPLDAGHD